MSDDVAIAITESGEPRQAVGIGLEIEPPVPVPVSLLERSVGILSEPRVKASGGRIAAVGIAHIKINAPVAVHAEDIAQFGSQVSELSKIQIVRVDFDEAAVVVEIPIMAQRAVVVHAAAVGALKAEPWASSISVQISGELIALAMVRINPWAAYRASFTRGATLPRRVTIAGRYLGLRDAWGTSRNAWRGAGRAVRRKARRVSRRVRRP
jgi:hypothetical protein